MLNNITDIVNHFHNPNASALEQLSERPDDQIDINALSKFGLPKEFLDILLRFDIEGFGVSWVNFLHIPYEARSLPVTERVVASLEESDNYNFPELANYEPGYVCVGMFDAGNILLKKASHMHSKSDVYMCEIGSGWNKPITKIADSFEQFMLILANFVYYYSEDYSKHPEIRNRIFDYFSLDIPTDAKDEWRWILV